MIGNDWDELLKVVWNSPGFNNFYHKILHEYDIKTIYPPKDYIFNALKLTSYKDTKVVIVGQDPYHGEHQAHGLSFSVQKGVKVPPSLQNIYKELYDDLGIEKDYSNGDLTNWQEQGVMLLNTGLTVEKDKPNSHKNIGWHEFTDTVIQKLNDKDTPVVFILWGNNAKEKLKLITNKRHFILTAPHPSPLSASRGFFGCKHFSKANEILKSLHKEEINWQINNI